MPAQFRISLHFLDGEFNGRGDGGESEWPPSPLRLFQALTNAAARLEGNGVGENQASALRWLETLKEPPEILAARTTPTNGYQLYVPNNEGDLVLKQWASGKYFDSDNHPIDIAGYRTDKVVRPLRLLGSAAVHYFWPLDENVAAHFDKHRVPLIEIARAITRLGWGVDLVVADAAFEQLADIAQFRTDGGYERWVPLETTGGTSLRVPASGTFDALETRHVGFLNRLHSTAKSGQHFRPVPPLSTFRIVTYRRDTEVAKPPYAVFALRRLDDSGFVTFDPRWRRLHLAGMLRHAASRNEFTTALGWDEAKVNTFVLGHDKSDPHNPKPTADAPRLIFIPLPSIEWRGEHRGHTVAAIRRVLVTVSGRCDAAEFQRIVRALEGQELIDEKTRIPVAFLRGQSDKGDAIKGYVGESAAWTTVTPVVLPGHDDPRQLRRRLQHTATPLTAPEKEQIIHTLEVRTERLLRKAFLAAGLPASLVAEADLQWRDTGFLPGADLASRYSAPDQCRRFRRLHVRVEWRERTASGELQPKSLVGPFCVGSGRFSGLGLFVPVS